MKKRKPIGFRQRTRPSNYPIEIVTLINGDSLGGYGTKVRDKKIQFLVDDGLTKNEGKKIENKTLKWIDKNVTSSVEIWTKERQKQVNKLNN